MCNKYELPDRDAFRRTFSLEMPDSYPLNIGPRQHGAFVRAGRVDMGRWGIIPWFSKLRDPVDGKGRPLMTNNCRSEGMATAATFRQPWARGQRCLIPAASFDEPYWGTGKNIWWQFARADGAPWALAGLWDEWTDKETGEVLPSYTMITQNCDTHPLLKLMHKPDPNAPPDQQDKRAVVPIEPADWSTWLQGSTEEARALIRLPALELIAHRATDPAKQVPLPIGVPMQA